MWMGSSCSEFENWPLKLSLPGILCSLDGAGSLGNSRWPYFWVDAHFPWMCAPQATPEASVLKASCTTRTFSFGPQGRPSSSPGGCFQ